MYEQIARYLQLQYPEVIYRFDLAADLKLTAGQAAKHKRLHPHRGYPDLFIAEPKTTTYTMEYTGLYLELKAEGNSPFKKDGTLKKNEHLEEQNEMLENLRDKGYKAEFAVGFEEAKEIIDDYLGGEK
jgi:flagellar biosynthesis/type III secretory pathway protein FliH